MQTTHEDVMSPLRPAVLDPIDLSTPDNDELVRGAPFLVEALWFFIGLPLLRSSVIPFSWFRTWLLRAFGAQIGEGVYFKPGLRVKFPWYLEIGAHCWIGEDVWIDNLAEVSIGAHCCVSQGAYFCTGNHDWSTHNLKLFRKSIRCERGSWVGAKAILCPGVIVGRGAIVAAGSVVTHTVPEYEIHAGNPARFLRRRNICSPHTTANTKLHALRS